MALIEKYNLGRLAMALVEPTGQICFTPVSKIWYEISSRLCRLTYEEKRELAELISPDTHNRREIMILKT